MTKNDNLLQSRLCFFAEVSLSWIYDMHLSLSKLIFWFLKILANTLSLWFSGWELVCVTKDLLWDCVVLVQSTRAGRWGVEPELSGSPPVPRRARHSPVQRRCVPAARCAASLGAWAPGARTTVQWVPVSWVTVPRSCCSAFLQSDFLQRSLGPRS